MPLVLRIVTSAHEIPEIVEKWRKHEFQLFPALGSVNWGSDESSYKDRIEDLSARQWYQHCKTPGSVWLKVIDNDLGGEVVAASRWNIQTEAPPSNVVEPPPARAYWLAPSPERRFMEAIRNNFAAVHADSTRQKPHIHLITNFTVAEHRRRCANTLMMGWGTRKADELGLEIWLESSALGSKIYAQNGFGFQHMVELYPSRELREDNKEWRHWEEATKDLRLAIMKRPVYGAWKDGEQDTVPFPRCDLEKNVWLKG
ncbi:MAG: hypothetical protein Q9220_007820 [cf. Caloplaca sp. 1 TL-2023]